MTLTGELLQKRLNGPIQEDGFSTIDLRQLDIDLTPENRSFVTSSISDCEAQLTAPTSRWALI